MDKLVAYLKQTIPEQSKWKDMEVYAKEHRVPIMEPVSMHFLLTLLHMQHPRQILEVGTAIGYSALRMAEELPETKITSIERNTEMLEIAKKNIMNASCENQIDVKYGNALEVMVQLQKDNETFDFIFIDAAKGQYERFFSLADGLLNPKGVIICDNILFRGFVAEVETPEQKRLQKLAEKLRIFNEKLMHNNQYKTTIVPIGDGLSISVKL